ncbi:MAG: PAS domain S-box protein [Anaerolineaceae bacterium]
MSLSKTFESAWDALPVPCLAFRGSGEIIYVNPAAVDLLGAGSASVLRSCFMESLLPDALEAVSGIKSSSAAPVSAVLHARRLDDGRSIRVDATFRLLDDSQTFICTLQDVSAFKMQEDDQGVGDTYFRTIFECAAIGIGIDDMEGRTIYSNPALERILGYSQDELRGMLHTQFSYPDDLAEDLRRYQDLLDGKRETYRYLKRYIRKDGRIIWGNLTISLLHEGKETPEHIIVMVEDITEQKMLEDALRRSEERWRSLAENTPDIIFTTDLSGTIRYCNHTNGGPLFTGDAVGWVIDRVTPPEDRDLMRTHVTASAERNLPEIFETAVKSGSQTTWYQVKIQPIQSQGKADGLTVIFSDITERKKMEMDLLEYNQRLEAMRELDQAILEAQSPINIVRATLEKIDRVIACTQFSVVIFDIHARNRKDILIVREHGETKVASDRPIYVDDFDIPKLQNGEIHVVQDMDTLSALNELEETYHQAGLRAYAILPLINQNNLVGLLTLTMTEPDTISEDIITKSWEVAHLLALAIQQTSLFQKSELRAQELEVIAQLSLELRQAASRREIYDSFFDLSVKTLHADSGALLLLEERGLRFVHCRGHSEAFLGNVVPEMRIPFWYVIRTGEALYISDEDQTANSTLPEYYRPLARDHTLAALIPVRSRETTIGVLHLSFRNRTEFNVYEQRLFAALTDIASNALERAEVVETLEKQVADRTWELETLLEVASATSSQEQVNRLLDDALDTILIKVGCTTGAVYLIDPQAQQAQLAAGLWGRKRGFEIAAALSLQEENVQKVMKAAEYIWLHDSTFRETADPERKALQDANLLCIPIRPEAETLGWIVLRDTTGCIQDRELKVLCAAADQIGMAVERHFLRQQANDALIIQERQRLARDLHDSVTQLLYSQSLLGEAGRNYLHSGMYDQASKCLNELVQTAHQALKEMRLMIYDLRPSILKEEGFIGALNYRLSTVEKRAGVNASLAEHVSRKLTPPEEEGLYRIVQEALNNSLKHSNATEIEIEFTADEHVIELMVRDNGIGFDPTRRGSGVGLDSIRERVNALGGNLAIESKPEGGSCVRVRIEKSDEDNQTYSYLNM